MTIESLCFTSQALGMLALVYSSTAVLARLRCVVYNTMAATEFLGWWQSEGSGERRR